MTNHAPLISAPPRTPPTSGAICYLHDHLTSRCISSLWHRGAGTTWDWIVANVAAEYDCDPESVDLIETDDGDKITAGGRVVAYTSRG